MAWGDLHRVLLLHHGQGFTFSQHEMPELWQNSCPSPK
jgi:hypothetical protein